MVTSLCLFSGHLENKTFILLYLTVTTGQQNFKIRPTNLTFLEVAVLVTFEGFSDRKIQSRKYSKTVQGQQIYCVTTAKSCSCIQNILRSVFF